MRFNSESLRRDYTFSVPAEELLAVLNYEDLNCMRAIENHVMLSEFLDKIPGLSGTEYNGHYGAHVFVSVDTEEEGWEYLVETADRIIGKFVDDAVRLGKFFPAIVKNDDDDTQDGKFTILYTDEDFVILGRDNETRVRVGHAGGTIYLDNADYILELIDEQRREYSINPEDNLYLPLIPARDIPEVREWVRTFVAIPKEAPLASVSVKGHRLAKALPTIGRPIWKNPDFVICDTGNDTVSVTFKTHESTGTKHYLEAAAAQVLDLVRSAKASPLSEDRLVRLLRNHVGSDLAPSFRR